MLLSNYIEVKLSPRNVNHYKDKGYTIPEKISDKSGEKIYDLDQSIIVKTEDLPNGSHKKVTYECDVCREIFKTAYSDWVHIKYKEMGIMCKRCAAKIKLPVAMLDKYGVDNTGQIPSSIEKRKKTCKERYGNEWAIAADQTRAKIKETMIKRYGVDNPQKSLKIQEKTRRTLWKNGKAPVSVPEIQMCHLLKEIFGEENCFPSYLEGKFTLDCMVKIGHQKIDFEYDGRYWHEGKEERDNKRNQILIKKGYKIVRIKGNKKGDIPTKEQITDAINNILISNNFVEYIDTKN